MNVKATRVETSIASTLVAHDFRLICRINFTHQKTPRKAFFLFRAETKLFLRAVLRLLLALQQVRRQQQLFQQLLLQQQGALLP